MTVLLPRPRLLSRLAQRWDRPVTAVVAGAGFGKSTLLLAALDAAAREADDRFVALGAGSGPEELVDGLAHAWCLGAPPPALDAVPWVVAAWWSLSPRSLCTTVDDAHHLDDEGKQLLVELSAALPPNAHLVVASRTPVVDGVAVLVDADALRLNDEELAGIAASSGTDLGDFAGSGGWPAAVAMAVAAPSGRAGEEDDVWRSVLATLDAPERRAVASLALAGPCDEVALERLLGSEAFAIVDHLLADVPLASWRRGRMDVHALWSAPALASLEPKTRRAVPIEVVRLLLEVGRASEAFALATEHGLATERLRIVRAVCGDERSLPDAATAGRWADAIGDREERLETELLRGISSRGRRPQEAAHHLRRAAGFARDEGDVGLETISLALLGTVAFARQDRATAAEVQRRARQMAGEGVAEAVVLVEMGRVIALLAAADPRAALERIEAVRARSARSLSSLCAFLEARSLCELGRAEAALEQLEACEGALRPYHFGASVIAARCHWMLGDVARADAVLAMESASSAADGRADDAAALEALRHLIATVTGRPRTGPPPTPTVAPLTLLLRALSDALGAMEDDPLQLERLLRVAMEVGGLGAVIPELRHLLWRAAPEVEQAPLDGTVESARRVGRALAAGSLPSSSEVVACLHLLPRPLVTELTTSWVAANHDERPVWSSSLTSSDRSAVRARSLHRGVGVPSWLLDPTHAVEVRVLGPLSVSVDGAEQLRELRRERVRALLWLLVVRPGVARREAATTLWPLLEPGTAANNLRTTLSYLGKVLDPTRTSASEGAILEVDRLTIRLRDDIGLVVDAWHLRAHLEEGRAAERAGRMARALQSYRAAAAQWRSEPARDVQPDEWVDRATGELRAAFVEAAVRASELLVGSDDAEALRLASRASEVDPWSLRARDIEVRANAGLGRDAAARQALVRHRALLAELGVDAGRAEPLAGIVARSTIGHR